MELQIPPGSNAVLVNNMFLFVDPVIQFQMRKLQHQHLDGYQYSTPGSVSFTSLTIFNTSLINIYFLLVNISSCEFGHEDSLRIRTTSRL